MQCGNLEITEVVQIRITFGEINIQLRTYSIKAASSPSMYRWYPYDNVECVDNALFHSLF